MEFGTLIDRIVKVDDHTVRFELSRAEAPFVADLGSVLRHYFSAEYADAMLKAGTPQRVDNDPIGTGPFQLVQYQKDAKILQGVRPLLGRQTGRSTGWCFDHAGCDGALTMPGEVFPNPADPARMRQDGNLQVMEKSGLNIGFLAFNTQKTVG